MESQTELTIAEIEEFKKFYNVGTIEKVVLAQAKHIERLQEKVVAAESLRPHQMMNHRAPREG